MNRIEKSEKTTPKINANLENEQTAMIKETHGKAEA